MRVDSERITENGLTQDCLGGTVVFRYQKTGGQFVCPDCGKVLGVPKMQRGTVVGTDRPTCKDCGKKGVLKYAQIITTPGTITRAILRKEDGSCIVAKVKLNKQDKFDKRIAREAAFRKLMLKCAA